MAAMYDASGNYIGDDGTPSLDQMKLELVKKNQPLSSQIPGYDRPIPSAQTKPDPLASAAGNFTDLATKFNPLMMAKSMREAAGIVTVPAIAALKGVGESLTTSPSGTYTSGQAPAYAEQVAKKFMEQNAPQTPMTQEFAGAIAPYMAELPAYLGHLQTGRPALTPNDVRVMGAEATRVGRQIKDIPTDFANAQSGLQKLDPITGQPTYGAKLQGAVESIGDIAAARRAEGKSLIPGIPDVVTPETSLYAVRPQGSRIARPVVPEGANLSRTWDKDVLDEVNINPLEPARAWSLIDSTIMQVPAQRNAFRRFMDEKYKELYPDAPTTSDAKEAFNMLYNDRNSRAAKVLGYYDEYLQSPEAAAIGANNLPSAAEVKARHDAASQWINNNLMNYIQKNVGAEGDPLVKLASEGLTYLPTERYQDALQSPGGQRLVEQNRRLGNMPTEGSLAESVAKKESEFAEAQSKVRELETKRRDLADIAMRQGLPDPAMLPEYAALTNPVRNAVRERDKLEEQLDNLKVGKAYEAAVDYGVIPARAKDFLTNELEYGERQFYPSVLKTPPEENVYRTYGSHLDSLGFNQLAKDFYNDVMSGDIPLDKVGKTTVENYVRNTAKLRIAEEKAAKDAARAYKRNAEETLRRRAQEVIPNDKTFGNAGVIELTKDTPEYDIIRTMSEDTAVLDHCVGQGGSAGPDDKNPWYSNGRRSYEPILDLVTGQPNPRATSDRTSYVRHVLGGDKIASIRDLSTGLPQATLHLEQSRLGANGQQKYKIGYASGHQNGDIDAKYTPAIRDYLNSIADQIDSAGHNLESHAGVYDMYDGDFGSAMRRALNMSKQQFEKYDLQSLPRFVTVSDVRAAVKAADLSTASPAKSELVELNHAMEDAMQEHNDLMRVARRRPLESAELDHAAELEANINTLRQRINDAEQRAVMSEPAPVTTPEVPVSYRMPSQAEAAGIISAIDDIGNQQMFTLRHEAGETARERFINTYNTLAYENSIRNLAQDNLPNFGRALQNLRDDIQQQIPGLRNMGFNGRAVATAFENLNDVIDRRLQTLQIETPEPALFADYPAEPFDFPRAVDRITNGVANNVGGDVGGVISERFNTVAHRIAEQTNPRLDPTGYAEALRRVNPAVEHTAVISALNELADQVELQFNAAEPAQPRPRAIAVQGDPMPNNLDARDILARYLDRLSTDQIVYLQDFQRRWDESMHSDELTNLETEFNQWVQNNQLMPDPAARPDYLRMAHDAALEADRDWGTQTADEVRSAIRNITEQLGLDPANNTDAFIAALREGADLAVQGSAETILRELADRMETEYMRDWEPEVAPAAPRRTADINNLRNERISQIEDMLGDATADADDLRRLANAVGNQFDADNHWMPLSETERRAYSQELRQRANYIEFNPRDFAQRLANEEGANIRELRDTIDALNAGNFDHEILRGLPVAERGRAEQATAAQLQILLQAHGHADGGPVQGYQAGGSVKKPEVKTPWLFSVPTYSETVAYEMYPGQKGQDDQRDAARHMLAAGTLSRKYGPGVAEFMGKAHEFTTSPLQAVKTLFGGQMPADYGMDVHNNTIGAQLGQRAKSQAELEDLVQEAAERASRTQTQDKAFIKKANGGIVQQNPTTDSMRYALMMRRK